MMKSYQNSRNYFVPLFILAAVVSTASTCEEDAPDLNEESSSATAQDESGDISEDTEKKQNKKKTEDQVEDTDEKDDASEDEDTDEKDDASEDEDTDGKDDTSEDDDQVDDTAEEGDTDSSVDQDAECLDCHAPYKAIQKATQDYVTPSGIEVNPHTTVDPENGKDPHSSGKGIVPCEACHTPHPNPIESVDEVEAPSDLDFCYSPCHHEHTFEPCSSCHEK